MTAPPCSLCRRRNGSRHRNGHPIRVSGRRFGLPGKLCDTCYERLRTVDQRINPMAPDPVPDGLTGETERERKRIERRKAIVRERLVIPRYERATAGTVPAIAAAG